MSSQSEKELFRRVEQKVDRGLKFAAGILLTFVFHELLTYKEEIIRTINVWGTLILVFILGIGLFILREKQRFIYGVFEFGVGVMAIISLFYPNHFNYQTIAFTIDFNIKLAGGLYIMVRGQDNIVRSFKGRPFGDWLAARGIGK